MIPVDIHGMATDENQEHYVVILHGKDQRDKWLPIQISPSEAQNIAIQLNEMEPERPLSHDLLATLTEELDGVVEQVRLDSRGSKELHGRVKLRKADGDETVLLDAAPSDAIALALRTDSEIVVEEGIMQTQDPTGGASFRHDHPSGEVTRLRDELEEAVANEEYERASELKGDIHDAVRRHEESVEDLGEDVDEQLEDAYEGSGSTEESSNDEGVTGEAE